MNESYKIISSSILFWFSQKKWFVYSILVSIFLLNLSTPVGLTIPAYHSLIILLLVFMLVTFEPIPFPAIALLTLVLQVVLGVAPPNVVASSFMNDAVLFVMGSLMFAIAIVHQGLDIRLAKLIIKIFGKSKRMFLAGLMTISAVLSSFLGEHTVIAIMLPIGLSVIKNIDTQQNSLYRINAQKRIFHQRETIFNEVKKRTTISVESAAPFMPYISIKISFR